MQGVLPSQQLPMSSRSTTRILRMLASGRMNVSRVCGAVPQGTIASSIPSKGQSFVFPSINRRFSSNVLAGRNIFQLKAAVDTVQAQSAQSASAAPAPVIELPTSDESEQLLRIRHSVRASIALYPCMWL